MTEWFYVILQDYLREPTICMGNICSITGRRDECMLQEIYEVTARDGS